MEQKRKVYTASIDEDGELGVYAISYVDKPAIMKDFVHFKEQMHLQKIDEEKRMVYGPAMIPDLPIFRVDKSGEEFYVVFPADVIEKMAHKFLATNSHQNMTADHDKVVEGSRVVESWVKAGDKDKSIELGFDELPNGSWFVGSKVDDEELWARIKTGEVRGFSIEIDMAMIEQDAQPEDEIIAEIEKIIKEG